MLHAPLPALYLCPYMPSREIALLRQKTVSPDRTSNQLQTRANSSSGFSIDRGRLMESVKIILLCVGTAIVYGICHDQITARVCVEYFTIGHPPIFGGTQDPTLLAFGWGVFATWWVGVMLGAPATLLARIGSRPKLGWRDLRIPLGLLMSVVAVSAIIGGIVGFAFSGPLNAYYFPEQ